MSIVDNKMNKGAQAPLEAFKDRELPKVQRWEKREGPGLVESNETRGDTRREQT
jgi:hypothetical protein